jgi:hypothetical protein
LERVIRTDIDRGQIAGNERRLGMQSGLDDGSMNVPGSDEKHGGHAARAGRDAISAVKLSQQLTADVDAWAEAHRMARSDAIRQLVELGLNASPLPRRLAGYEPANIEDRAVEQIERMLDPSLPEEERERRIRRLTEGPPEFTDQRIDLPKQGK